MGLHWRDWPAGIAATLRGGTVIPAHPLALTARRDFDPVRQRALSRYYLDAGAGGLAVGVHTTQFAVRDVGFYRPVLEIAAEAARTWVGRPVVLIAGVIGRTRQALDEARLARSIGYHAVLVSLAAFRDASDSELIAHCRRIAREMPLVGFYLQPAVGGRVLSARFWERFARIDNAVAVKIAPFNRYRTLDVLRGIARAGAADRIALYTGNDDHILLDLVTPFDIDGGSGPVRLRMAGGLLGHWSVWVQRVVELHARIRALGDAPVPQDLLALDAQITDCNAAIFDVANGFAGCIAGCHEILRRQGLLQGVWCIDPHEGLGPGQAAEIDRVTRAYPHLADDDFVRANLARWLA